jgi:hypothetical protein
MLQQTSNTKQFTSVRWSEFDRNDRIVIKEKEFSSSKALETFISKLENKSNFNEVIAYA